MGGLQTPVSRAMLRLMITRLTLNEAPTIAFGGASFGNVGTFEKIHGRAFGELDPANPLNAVITDITLTPRNARGMVEYTVDFYILRPVNPSRGNKVMVFDVTNRGNKRFLSVPTPDGIRWRGRRKTNAPRWDRSSLLH
jgi:hypothetical protein